MHWLRSLLLVLLCALTLQAADWPGWLGPRRDGTSSEKVEPWKGDLKVLWRKPVGPGHSSPVMAGNRVYLHTRVPGQEREQMAAYDALTGKEIWQSAYDREKFSSPFGTGPQATPQFFEGKLYTFGATGILACFEADKGELLWKVPTREKFKAPSLFFGAACSPLVDGDQVVVNVGGEGASVVAFDRHNGMVKWQSLDDKASYSSGIIRGQGQGREYVFLTQQGLRGFAPETGKKLWDFPLVDKLNESSTTPVLAGDLILASSVTFGMVGVKVEPNADGAKTAQRVWFNRELTCYFSTPIPVGKEHVYLVTGQATLFNPTSNLHCIEAKTGKVLWTKPRIGKYHAAMLKTGNDRLLMLTDLGDLVLIQPDPKEYKELARSKVVKGEQIWAHPALVEGKVYFRDEKELICLELPK